MKMVRTECQLKKTGKKKETEKQIKGGYYGN